MTELAECDGLENRCARKGTGGSNPPLSANKKTSIYEVFLLVIGMRTLSKEYY